MGMFLLERMSARDRPEAMRVRTATGAVGQAARATTKAVMR